MNGLTECLTHTSDGAGPDDFGFRRSAHQLRSVTKIEPRRFASSGRPLMPKKKSFVFCCFFLKKELPCVRRESVSAPLTLSTIETLSLDKTFLKIISDADT